MLSIIIVHYGEIKKTIGCLNSIVQKIKIPNEILIWDNSEETENKLFEKEKINFPDLKFKILTIHKNTGYGAGINRAVDFCQYEWILILNNDVNIVRFDFKDMDKRCIYGASALDENGNPVKNVYLDLNPLDELMKNMRIYPLFYRLGYGFGNEAVEDFTKKNGWTYNVGGSFILLTKDIFKNIGGFDENYFLYAEEFDFCKRARLKGYKIKYSLHFKIVHPTKKSYNRTIMEYRIRSKLYYLKKFFPALNLFTLFSNMLVALIYILLLYIQHLLFSRNFTGKGADTQKFSVLYSYYKSLLMHILFYL